LELQYGFSEEMIKKETTISIGSFEDWIEWSDHTPLIIDNLGS